MRHPPVRTYKKRAGRVTATQQDAIDRLWPRFGLLADGRPLDVASLFGRRAPVVVEVGFGTGDATAEMAAAAPEVDVLAVDVHTPGHGNLLKLVEQHELTNVRVADGDARTVLAEMLGPGSLVAVRVFFPDPWPKARHAKRRLVDDRFAALVAGRLADGGVLHVATDDPAYAEQVRAVVARERHLRPVAAPWRPVTKYERRGRAAGRPAFDVAAVKSG